MTVKMKIFPSPAPKVPLFLPGAKREMCTFSACVGKHIFTYKKCVGKHIFTYTKTYRMHFLDSIVDGPIRHLEIVIEPQLYLGTRYSVTNSAYQAQITYDRIVPAACYVFVCSHRGDLRRAIFRQCLVRAEQCTCAREGDRYNRE